VSIDEREFSRDEGRPRRLFLFTMGNTRWAYAAGSEPVTFLADQFTPLNIILSAYQQSLSEGAPSVTVTLDSSAAIAQQFVAFMPVQPMTVRVYKYEEDDPDSEYDLHFMGEVVAAAFDEEDGLVTLECRTVSSKIDRNVPWPVYQKPCNRALYSVGCGVDPEQYRTHATLSAVNRNEIRSPAFAEHPDGWFLAGFVRTELGESRLVVYHVGDTLILQAPFVYATADNEVDAFAGCDLRRSTCKIKFNNYPRWMGFPRVPGNNPYAQNVFGSNPTTAGAGED
jgi:uncharacterized phage protein (TIGR02218 family)